MFEVHKQHVWRLALIALLAVGSGCKSGWPLGGKVSDTVAGIDPPRERIAALKQLAKQAAGGGPAERERIAGQVAAMYPHETDPQERQEIDRT
jgi:hypothetical protein